MDQVGQNEIDYQAKYLSLVENLARHLRLFSRDSATTQIAIARELRFHFTNYANNAKPIDFEIEADLISIIGENEHIEVLTQIACIYHYNPASMAMLSALGEWFDSQECKLREIVAVVYGVQSKFGNHEFLAERINDCLNKEKRDDIKIHLLRGLGSTGKDWISNKYLAGERNPKVRGEAVVALRNIALRMDDEFVTQAIKKLTEITQNDHHRDVRQEAISSLLLLQVKR